ncbi:MAG TPA: protease modulator HflK [Fimbriiglobus sp.]|jgi:membrane protease subunit HflK
MRWRYALLIALVAYLATGIAQVRPDERAVVRRFGRVVARPGPGLWIGLPWGMDRVDRVQVRTVRQLSVGTDESAIEDLGTAPVGQVLTGDQNLINVRLVAEYAVSDRDGDLENYVLNKDRVDPLLAELVEGLTAEWAATRGVDEALLTGRAALAAWLADKLPERLTLLHLGIILQRVSVTHLAAPEAVREAFEEVTQAQAAIRTKENEATRDAGRRMRDAEVVAFRSEQQAAAYRTERLEAAKADAANFLKRLAQYRELKKTNPDVLVAIWWDEMGKVLLGMKGRGRIDLLDSHLGADGLDITTFLPPKRK